MQPLTRDLEHVLAHTEDAWRELAAARLFLTGGTGFFGCWLLETFAFACDRLGLDASMVVLTRSPEAFREKAPHLAAHPRIELLRGDIRSFAFPEGRFSHVIHAATDATPVLNRDHPLVVFDSIVEGTRRTLDFAAASGAQRFLLTSSGAVYGRQPLDVMHVPETYPSGPDVTSPHAAYGEGKRAAELLCAAYSRAHRMDCLITRGFAFVGPYLPIDAHFAIGNFIRDCLDGQPIRIQGDGTPFRSYLYTADLAIWLWTILVRGESCRPYNVGSEREVSIAELAATVGAALGISTPVRVEGGPDPGAPAERYVPDTKRARVELGLEEWIPLEEAIRRTAEWHAPAAVREQQTR